MFTIEDLRLPDATLYDSPFNAGMGSLAPGVASSFVRCRGIGLKAAHSGSALRVALLLAWQAGVQRRSRDLTIPTESSSNVSCPSSRVLPHALRQLRRTVNDGRSTTRAKARVTPSWFLLR